MHVHWCSGLARHCGACDRHMARPHCAPLGTMAMKFKAFLSHLNVPQWSCLRLARAEKGFKSKATDIADDPGSKAMANICIAALAESIGIFASQNESVALEDSGSKIDIVVIWTIVLCTIIGPVSVVFLIRRVKKLQLQRRDHGGGEDPLGI